MNTLHTERLVLRSWDEANDLKPLIEFFSDAEASHFIGGPRDAEAVWRTIASYIGHFHLRGYSYWAVADRVNNKLIGATGIWNSPQWGEMELGYYIFPAHQGKGFATEAAKRCQQYVFEDLGKQTLVSYINAENEASKKVAKKLGGTFDGIYELAEFGPHEVYRYGST